MDQKKKKLNKKYVKNKTHFNNEVSFIFYILNFLLKFSKFSGEIKLV